MPDYMRSNPKQWVYDDIEECCKNYYGWEKGTCIEASGGDPVEVSTGKWYANHNRETCLQDCPEDMGGSCGGLADTWDELYSTAANCCDSQLSWIAPSVCEARSTLTIVIGTQKWFVDWRLEKVSSMKC